MLIANEASFETRYEHLRAGARLNSRVAVAVEWVDGGQSQRAEGFTVDVGPKGCLAIVQHKFTVGQKLQLTNLINKKTSEAILIWRGHERQTGWELGLEIQGKTEDFWEIQF